MITEFGFKCVRSTNAYLWPFRSYQPVIMGQSSRIWFISDCNKGLRLDAKKKTNLHHGDFIKVKFDKYECKSVIISCDSVAIVSMTKFLCYNIQGHPTTVFCKISVRRSKFWLEFSISWGRLKISRWLFHSCDFRTFNFSHFTAQVRLFFAKSKPKFFGFKNVMERGIRKFSPSLNVKLHLNISEK